MHGDGAIGDVYRYSDGYLEHHSIETAGVLVKIPQRARPNTYVHGGPNWPKLSDLKRLRVTSDTSTRIPTYTIISFMMPSTGQPKPCHFNVLSHAYTHPHISGTSWRNIAKQWRDSLHVRHRHTSEFALATFSDPDYDLRKLTTQFNALPTEPKRIETLWKLMNKSLYIGEVGMNYTNSISKRSQQATLGRWRGHVYTLAIGSIHNTRCLTAGPIRWWSRRRTITSSGRGMRLPRSGTKLTT